MKKSTFFLILIQLLCFKSIHASDWNNSSIFNYKVFIENKGQLSHNENFLTDPIEDRTHTWDDYKINYEATYTAELLYPTVYNYEVMPWPHRIYLGKFKNIIISANIAIIATRIIKSILGSRVDIKV